MVSRLKSLELQGYKTFANRTNFEFPGAVTAIVGPNGSGKSNITDALRWVLGEQSYSLLRGKKTEDMIFAGSERRTRSGMATATVILDNSDSWLPIDYSEVAIARRAYRDGSNEYLLNGQKVRLRDVSELLAESGLAERTYTIIGQGLVDAALALRAEDRRRLFEEAAGIGLHRTRRQEAVRRLADTERNLERVEDILHELRPRLRSLERQAKRAQEYDQAVEDLRGLLREWYGYHWHRAQQELSEAQSLANEQSDSLEGTRQREMELDAEIGRLRDERSQLRSNLNELHAKSAQLHRERENTSRELAVSEERARNLVDQEQKLKSDLALISEEFALLEERRTFALGEVEGLSDEFAEAQVASKTVNDVFKSRREQIGKVEAKLSELRQELINLSALREEVRSRRAESGVQITSLINSKNKAEETNTQDKTRLEELTVRVDDAKKVSDQAKERQNEIEQALDELQQETRQQNLELQQVAKALAEDESGLEGLRTRARVLQQAEDSHAGYSQGAKSLLESFGNQPVKGLQGLLGSNLRVAKEYEVAIGAALGDYLDGIVLEGAKNVDQALEILDRKSEKGVLLPLDLLEGKGERKEIVEQVGVIGWAADLVETPRELKPVIEILLANTWVVQDRQTARELISKLRELPDPERELAARIITLSGEIFHATGQVQRGAGNSPASLSRPREQRELQMRIAEKDTQISGLRQQVHEIESRIAAGLEEEKNLLSQLDEARAEAEKAAAAHSHEKVAFEQMKREIQWREGQIEAFSAEVASLNEKVREAEGEIGLVDERISDTRQLVQQEEERLQDLPVDSLERDISHWATRMEIIKQGLQAAQTRQTEREQLLSAAKSRKTNIEVGLQEILDERKELESNLEVLKNTSQRVAGEIEACTSEITPAEAAMEEVEDKLSEFLRLESRERVMTSQAEQSFTQARISQIRKQEALDSLRRQIEADFGLVAFEYHEDVSGPTPLPLEGIVEDLPLQEQLRPGLEEVLKRQRALLRRIGPINPEAQAEYMDVSERFEFLSSQMNDLQEALEDVQRVIAELDEIMQREFCNTFDAVAEEFRQIFGRLFGGGSARLILTEPEDLSATGIDIEARLPGRREQGLSLLSGGERSLTAVALVFSLLRVSPTPFCVLDEVDAMLDEANVGRFRELLRELSGTTQFILITHNRATVQVADIIYGVTMGRDSTSQILSLKVDELEQVIN